MIVEALLSVAMLGGFLWVLGFLLPKALKEDDRFAIGSAVVAAGLALLGWLLMAARVASR